MCAILSDSNLVGWSYERGGFYSPGVQAGILAFLTTIWISSKLKSVWLILNVWTSDAVHFLWCYHWSSTCGHGYNYSSCCALQYSGKLMAKWIRFRYLVQKNPLELQSLGVFWTTSPTPRGSGTSGILYVVWPVHSTQLVNPWYLHKFIGFITGFWLLDKATYSPFASAKWQ